MRNILLAALMVTSFISGVANAAENSLTGSVALEAFDCTKGTDDSVQCRSTGKTYETQNFDVKEDSGDAAYLTFTISDKKLAQVKVGTNSSSSSFFLTTGISGADLALKKSLFSQGETIFEISPKEGLRSIQIYSPEFELDGALKMLKATISVR